jgi:Fe2+ transport system protein FeoA
MKEEIQARPLSEIDPGHSAELVSIVNVGGTALRLAELGLTPGTRLRVCRAQNGQPLLISVRGSRLAIDRELTNHMLVLPLEGCACGHQGLQQHGKRHRHQGKRRWFK